MQPFNIPEKKHSLKQSVCSPGRLAEPPKVRKHHLLHLHEFRPCRKTGAPQAGISQQAFIPEKLLKQISRLLSHPSLGISLQDIRQKLEQLVEEKQFRKKQQAKFSRLTPREKEVLLWLARGLPNGRIAAQLSISIQTVKHHRKIIKSKLEVSSTADFIRYAQAFKLEEMLRKM